MHFLQVYAALLIFPLIALSAVIPSPITPRTLAVPNVKRFPVSKQSECDISTRLLPKRGTLPELPIPESKLQLKYIALGVGTQNYTCSDSTNKPTAVGAVATLYDASCLQAMKPQAVEFISTICLRAPLASTSWMLERLLKMPTIGQHYFSDGKPFFDLSTHGGSDKALVSVVAKVPAPREGDVPWLRLETTEGSGIKTVFRVNTHEGSSPETCQGRSPEFQVRYTAEYWIYG